MTFCDCTQDLDFTPPTDAVDMSAPTETIFLCEALPPDHWFVSNDGDDTWDGRTILTPFATIAHLEDAPLTATSTVFFRRGDVWREELTGDVVPVGITIDAYGDADDDPPLIDGRAIALNASFAAVGGGTPNVYSIAWSHGFAEDGGKSHHHGWCNGTMLMLVDNISLCNAAPGTMVIVTPTTGGPDTLYIHPYGSTNPIADGKEYQFSARRWALQLYAYALQARVSNIDTIGNSYADGSRCIDGYASRCRAMDGYIHAAFHRGTMEDCEDTVTDDSTDYSVVVSYMTVSTPGASMRTTVFRRCTTIAPAGSIRGNGFFAHTDGVRMFGAIQYESCHAQGSDGGFSGNNVGLISYYDCSTSDCRAAHAAVPDVGGNPDPTALVLGGFYDLRDTSAESKFAFYSNPTSDYTWTGIFHGAKIYKRPSNGGGPFDVNFPEAVITVDRCSMVSAPGAGIANFFSRGHFTVTRCASNGPSMTPSRIGYILPPVQVDSFSADYNCWHSTLLPDPHFQSWAPTLVTYNSIAAWSAYLVSEALGAGVEANSVNLDPQFADPANGDFTVGNATVIALGAGAYQDEEDDADLQALWNLYKVADPA